jgi:hypothetical protein
MSEEQADFEELVDLAGKELERRFRQDPDSLPGTFVIKLFLDGNKAMRAGDVPEDGPVAPDPDVLDLVQSDGLPWERKRELLETEREKCVQRLHDIDTFLGELND